MAKKRWYRSKTVRVNLALLVLAAVESQLHIIQPLLPVNFYALMAFILPPVNAALRFLAQQPVSFWGEQ